MYLEGLHAKYVVCCLSQVYASKGYEKGEKVVYGQFDAIISCFKWEMVYYYNTEVKTIVRLTCILISVSIIIS